MPDQRDFIFRYTHGNKRADTDRRRHILFHLSIYYKAIQNVKHSERVYFASVCMPVVDCRA